MAEYPVRATLAGVLLFVIGLAIAGSTVIAELRDREAREAWIKANGTVVDVLPAPANGSPRPVVSFDTPEGERIRFTPIGPSPWRALKVGDSIPVIYPFGLPGQARIDPRSFRRTRTAIALGAALVLMALGGYVARYASRRGAPDGFK
ncbi:MAG TPA: DUF3592 domain-containing protein [Vicinamibacterales bacterium]|nr:DUF3592 domain-containing protein [Vicinamibacterales bacterium]